MREREKRERESNMAELTELTEAVLSGKRKIVKDIVPEFIDTNVAPEKILDAMLVAMNEIGAKFKKNEIFVPEVLIAARAMNTGMELLEPILVSSGLKPEHKVVIGTVKGDLHDIGKNLVGMMLKGANFEVVDLGSDVTPEAFLEKAKEVGASAIALSALLTTTMPAMSETVRVFKEAGLDNVKVMVGGAPVTQAFCDEIGADGYAPDAATAVDCIKELIA